MSKLRLITVFLFAVFMVLGVTAQVHTQKGIVRKVTRSASDPFIPVQGVQVIVSGEANKASDKDGRFSLKVKVTDKAGSYTPIRDKIAISCMLRQIHESSSHAIRHGLYIKNRKRLFCP